MFSGGGGKLSELLQVFYRETCICVYKVAKNIIKDASKRYKIYNAISFLAGWTYKEISANDIKTQEYSLSKTKIFVVNDIYVSCFTDFSYMHDAACNILKESAPFQEIKNLPHSLVMINNKKIIKLDKAVNLALKPEYNYWHFTFMALDKIIELEENNFNGFYLLFDRPWIRELVKLASLPEDRIIYIKDKEVYLVKNLHIIEKFFLFDKNTILKIRDRILGGIDLNNISNYPKHLFVNRKLGCTRTIKNIVEVTNLLKKYNYEIFIPEEFSVEEQIKHFYAAEVVVTPHGANSTNALYMRENSHFIECFGKTYIMPCMLDNIIDNKINYNMVVSCSHITDRNKSNCEKNSLDNYEVNLMLLESVIYNL